MKQLEEAAKADKKAVNRKKICSDPTFKDIVDDLHTLAGKDHPKLDKLKTIMMQHFGSRMEDSEEDAKEVEETRAMVFVNFRRCVDDIVESLNQQQPLIRAHRFIGQAAGKDGVKGMTQKEQGQV
jgi:ATP-dependent DNA helicase MPH1